MIAPPAGGSDGSRDPFELRHPAEPCHRLVVLVEQRHAGLQLRNHHQVFSRCRCWRAENPGGSMWSRSRCPLRTHSHRTPSVPCDTRRSRRRASSSRTPSRRESRDERLSERGAFTAKNLLRRHRPPRTAPRRRDIGQNRRKMYHDRLFREVGSRGRRFTGETRRAVHSVECGKTTGRHLARGVLHPDGGGPIDLIGARPRNDTQTISK